MVYKGGEEDDARKVPPMTEDHVETSVQDAAPRGGWGRHRLLLAVSGGADSVALLVLFAKLVPRDNLLALHVNHKLRDDESDGDADFCVRLAEKYRVPIRVASIDPAEMRAAAAREGGLEAGARAIRYRLLLENAEAFGARYVLTAHHADDQIETILYRLFRGSGIDGLAGMSRFRPLSEAVVLARPFLALTRADLTGYLTRLGESWRVDSSNLSPDFLRNRIRHELLPLLRDLFPGKAEGSILKLAAHAARLKEFLESRLGEADLDGDAVFPERGGGVRISAERLAALDPLLAAVFFRRLWRRMEWPMGEMDVSRWEALIRMTRGEGPRRRSLPGGLTAQRRGGDLLIAPAPAEDEAEN